jgi:methylmalonyl-CoA/ethylmalonyl-CoA epimerase
VTVHRIDHTAIAVRDLDEAIDRYERLYGIPAVERAIVPDQRVEVAFLALGDTSIELVSPLDDSSGVARFLAKHGEGLHHIGLAVDDLELELDRLARDGVELIDRVPRAGVHGRIAFCHPRGTGGILVELVQHETRDTP